MAKSSYLKSSFKEERWSLFSGYAFLSPPAFFFFFFSQLHLQHVEVLGLGVKSELQLWPLPQSQQCWIQAASVTYTQLVAMPDLQPTEQGQGLNPHPHGH